MRGSREWGQSVGTQEPLGKLPAQQCDPRFRVSSSAVILQRLFQELEHAPAPARTPLGWHFPKQMHLLDAYGEVPLRRAIRLPV